MVKELAQKVAAIFEGAYLLASLLPALLFLFAAGVTLAVVIGPSEAWKLIGSWKILDESTEAILFIIALVAFTYLLSALRPFFLKLWTGTIEITAFEPLYVVGRALQRRVFKRLSSGIPDPPSTLWADTLRRFQEEVKGNWDKGKGTPLTAEIERLQGLAERLNNATAQDILNDIIKAYLSYTGNSLEPVYRTVFNKLNELKKEEERQRLGLADLDRRFGKIDALAPTELGNVIQAYNDYPFERYRMEGEVFWPRLQKVISPEFRRLVEDQQTLLDFSLTSASLSVLYGFLALFLGPWLWTKLSVWIVLAVASFSAAYLFYRLGCLAAWRLGDFIRSSFDLFRLDLLKSLGSVPPQTIKEERILWTQFSRLLVYSGDFTEVTEVKLQVPEP